MADQRSVVNRDLVETGLSSNFLLSENLGAVYRRRPRRPPFLLVESDGIGVTSSDQSNEERKKNKRKKEVKHCRLEKLLHYNANFNYLQAQFTLGQSSCTPVLKGSQNCSQLFPFSSISTFRGKIQPFTAYFSYSGRQNLTATIFFKHQIFY